MEEKFIPQGQVRVPEVVDGPTGDLGQPAAPAPAIQTPMQMTGANPDQMAQVSLATEVMNKPAFTDLLQKCAQFELFSKGVKVESDEALQFARERFVEMKAALKDAEEIRTTAILFPRKFTDAVNQLFRENVRNPIEAAKGKVGKAIDAYLDELDKKRKAAEEAAAKAAETAPVAVTSVEGDGAAEPDGVLPPGVVPASTVKTDAGSTHRRETTTVEITDPVELLKAIVSAQKKNVALTVDLVEFRMGALKEVIKDNPRRIKWPGIEVKKVKKSI